MPFFFNHAATAIERSIEMPKIAQAEICSVPIAPNQTFIPRNDEMMVGIDKTIVMPARNFMMLLRLLETTLA